MGNYRREQGSGGQTRYVNVYETSQEYGGPEEGGWYYTAGEPVESVKVPRNAGDHVVRAIVEEKKKQYEVDDFRKPGNYGRRRSEHVVLVEGRPGRPYPEVTPHYE